jgi:hypothetical protein
MDKKLEALREEFNDQPRALQAVKATAVEFNYKVIRKILLNPKVWVAIFDFLGILLFKQLNIELDPELLVTSQALVLVIIATLKESE